jgi:hypothetical protein
VFEYEDGTFYVTFTGQDRVEIFNTKKRMLDFINRLRKKEGIDLVPLQNRGKKRLKRLLK